MLAQPILAIAFGAFFLCGETCLHFGDIIASGAFLTIIAVLLIVSVGALVSILRHQPRRSTN